MKKLLTIASAAAFASLATPAFAFDGTINFTGTISSVTCSLAAAGGTNVGSVTLPTVTQSSLKNPGDTAGTTQFSIKLSGCTGTATQASAWFESGPEINASGRILTTIAGANTDTLSIALYNMGSATPISIGQSTVASAPFTITSGSATLNYQAKYYAEKAVSAAGAVVGKVNYTIQYQ
ncbi:fimbrial protein [Aquitalea sp. LB_tupeE]|uniref:fimbrial protein n=1 Tax=Aquitalea sp. LB_tupeE TaxID=2748078 RepID=UPI0015B78EC1|nr:fimbrial protein [Aquitalea sp. LB_tupeE]NWK76796.1 type 1 fimbrial protein [Aquitalea sp. LB_tupeE]